ncbi:MULTISPECIES: sulfur carrier protein ThiS [Sphingobacterium]|uniref:Sulfur carrier protein ThiS n=1 Tax=Sphingobacterium hotanense TaxID=649196 RepID=A0ABT7NK53_9SPHI|nr:MULTISPECIES: sulfur carrier protein ThiS [Sphingobacterium]MDM1047613.1 sulfur carrier protein ThiS [Sphingobacterium hotanense]
MELTINQQSRYFEKAPESLAALLASEIGVLRKGTAVAVNNKVIPAVEWAETTLSDRDHILIITATQGG